jgi:tRNA modification GTPase
VRASGEGVRALIGRVFVSGVLLLERVATLGRVVDARGATIDEGLALFFAAPRSYTGEDLLELHVHGSPAVVRDVLAALLEAGARLAGPGEFTRRAFLAGKLDLSAAEAVADLIEAEHRSAARAAAARLAGGVATEVERVRAEIDDVLEALAAAVDFPDEVNAPERADLSARLAGARDALAALAKTWEHGRLVREGVTVAIVGASNAGKSSLLNALLGAERALVSEFAGTTRDTIEETLALDGFVARIVDTAGIRRLSGFATGAERVEAAGIARSEAALAQSRVALVVVDASVALSADAAAIVERTRGRERVVLYNKADLGRAAFDARDPWERDALLGSAFDALTVTALKGALRGVVLGDQRIDVERPSLASARQADAVLEARRALDFALQTLTDGAPIDLLAGDLMAATRALGQITGREASEALLDAIFARFCVGK